MDRIVKSDDFNEDEWDCTHWGVEHEEKDGFMRTVMYAPSQAATRNEEEQKGKGEEEDQSSNDGDTDDEDLVEKEIVYRLPHKYWADTVPFAIDASRLALDLCKTTIRAQNIGFHL